MKIKEYIDKSKTKTWNPQTLPDNVWKSNWPFAYLDFKDNFEDLHHEVENLPEKFWVDHRAKDKIGSYSHRGWQSVTLHGISYDKTEHFDRYGFETEAEASYIWTEVCEYLPAVTSFLKNLEYSKYSRVRLMKLAPQGYIMPHTDGSSRVFGPLNIALNNPKGCDFVFENYGVVPFKAGRGVFPDIGNTHAVYNNSAVPRVHIIVHGEINPKLMAEAVTTTYNGLHKRYI